MYKIGCHLKKIILCENTNTVDKWNDALCLHLIVMLSVVFIAKPVIATHLTLLTALDLFCMTYTFNHREVDTVQWIPCSGYSAVELWMAVQLMNAVQ